MVVVTDMRRMQVTNTVAWSVLLAILLLTYWLEGLLYF
jgi:hypothetical protein